MTTTSSVESALAYRKTIPACAENPEDYPHAKRVADILMQLNMDEDTVIAGVLHGIHFTQQESEYVKNTFGDTVIHLAEGVEKISRLTIKCKTQQEADSVRKMIFALIDDIRIVMIKLADKLDRMRNLKGVDIEKQRRNAYEAIGIWAPIANRLGISSVKDELEDLSLKFSNPDVFAQIKHIVALKKSERAEYLDKVIKAIAEAAEKAHITVTVKGRAKHFYSIYQKMRKRNKNADELYDLLAIRILCSNTVECYTLIGIVHTLWQPVDGRFKDYIAKPKQNGYQSLHTTVLCDDKPLEIQIRTFSMHEMAENGVASHWLYKKGANKDSGKAEDIVVVSKMKKLGNAVASASHKDKTAIETDDTSHTAFFAAIKEELLGKSVFVFTPRGDIIELHAGSCAIDFAYAIHSSIGEKITGAKADGQIIPLSIPLVNTQVIEVITNPNAHPTINQLRQVQTPKARAKIRAWLNENDAMFMHTEKPDEQSVLPQNPQQTHRGRSHEEYLHEQNLPQPTSSQTISARIRIGDTSNFLFSFAHCCTPVFGDYVVGYVSRGRGIIVHKESCPNVWKIPNIEQRLIQVEWDTSEKKTVKKAKSRVRKTEDKQEN